MPLAGQYTVRSFCSMASASCPFSGKIPWEGDVYCGPFPSSLNPVTYVFIPLRLRDTEELPLLGASSTVATMMSGPQEPVGLPPAGYTLARPERWTARVWGKGSLHRGSKYTLCSDPSSWHLLTGKGTLLLTAAGAGGRQEDGWHARPSLLVSLWSLPEPPQLEAFPGLPWS